MGARGPLPQSNVVRIRRANPGGKAAPAHPVVPKGPIRAPGSLDAGGRTLFLKAARDLEAAGMYAPVDAMALALAVQHYRIASDAAKKLLIEGPISDSSSRDSRLAGRNPVTYVFTAHSAAYLEYAKQFGMVPVARLRTTLAVEPPDPGDDQLFDT